MGEMTSEGSNLGAGIDLSQFYQVFFEEAGENLARMEQQLLEIDLEQADDEELNSIFRCAHSVKGGAATFGFADVAELTHQKETLLGKLRRHEVQPSASMVDVRLASGDALKAMVARHQGTSSDVVDTSELPASSRMAVAGEAALPPVVVAASAPPPVVASDLPEPMAASAQAAATSGRRTLELQVGPLANLAEADNLVDLFKEITDLGTIESLPESAALPGIRRFKVDTASDESDLLDLFTFHVAREQVKFLPWGPMAAAPQAAEEEAYGFFDDAPGAPAKVAETSPGSPT